MNEVICAIEGRRSIRSYRTDPVPEEKLEDFRAGIDGVLGIGACHVLSIRPQGGAEVTV